MGPIGVYELYQALLEHYGPQHWWPAKDEYEMMVGAVLTQNTAWSNVEKAIANFQGKLTPQLVAGMTLEELGSVIRPSGFFTQKSVRIKALTAWYGRYGYSIQQVREQPGELLRQELLAIPGIGRETADDILCYACRKPFFVIDAYTRRIIGRAGHLIPEDYDTFREWMEAGLPRDVEVYQEFHGQLVVHAKNYCRKVPLCDGCPLEDICQKRIEDSTKKVSRRFYRADGIALAKGLLGKILVHKSPEGVTAGKIVEAEAYMGDIDAAAHAKTGKPTKRTAIQYGDGGYAYVYLIYGMHHCFNIVASVEGIPQSVLIRALEPTQGLPLMQRRRGVKAADKLCAGPGTLCKAMGITMEHYGMDLCGKQLYLLEGEQVDERRTLATPRINVGYAGEAAEYPWRFVLRRE